MILIIGCGFLGSYLAKTLAETSDERLVCAVRDPGRLPDAIPGERIVCDVTNEEDICRLAQLCKGEELTVFYFAACHNIDAVYANPAAASRVNIGGLKAFLDKMPGIRRLFFSSTDCVYGENSPEVPVFAESSPLHPVNVYGRQKAEAENIVLSHGFTVLRFGYLLGPSLISRPHFYDKIRNSLLAGKQIEMIDGLRRSVLSYRQAAGILAELSRLPKQELPPVINVCSDVKVTKTQMGHIIAKSLGASPDLIRPISENDGRKFFKDARASSAVMDNSLLKKILGVNEIGFDASGIL